MKRNLLVVLAAAATLFAPIIAEAGTVVIDGRVRPIALQQGLWNTNELVVSGATSSNGNGSGSGDNGNRGDSGAEPTPRELEDALKKGNPVGPWELRQIQAGLITEEEATSGCNAGASSASLLPLLVAATALARRRRRS